MDLYVRVKWESAFCDGSHKKTADEEAGKVYRYNPDGTRSEIQ